MDCMIKQKTILWTVGLSSKVSCKWVRSPAGFKSHEQTRVKISWHFSLKCDLHYCYTKIRGAVSVNLYSLTTVQCTYIYSNFLLISAIFQAFFHVSNYCILYLEENWIFSALSAVPHEICFRNRFLVQLYCYVVFLSWKNNEYIRVTRQF